MKPQETFSRWDPLAVPVAKAHLLVGCSQSSFYKIWISEGWVKPVDLGGRGQSVIVEEVRAAMYKRAEAIRSGAIVAPIRSARGKKQPAQVTAGELEATDVEVGLETITQFAAENARSNRYPATPWAVRGLHRNREIHGLSDAFVTAGRRVLVNRTKFYELLNQSTRKTSNPFVPSKAPTRK